MSAIVRETSEYVEMSDSITLCIVKDGAAGTSLNMKTGVSSTDALPSSGASAGDSYVIDGHLWTYTGGTASDATHHNGFTDCGKVSGEAGKNNYVHVAWSNKQNPTKDDIVLSNTDGNAYAYMGTWVSETKEDTADEAVTMAKWVYVKGDNGTDGAQGASGYSYAFSVLKKVLRVSLPSGNGEISDDGITLNWDVDMSLYKLDGKGNISSVKPDLFKATWVLNNGTETYPWPSFTASGDNISGNGSASYDITSATRISQLRIEAAIGGKVIAQQVIDVEIEVGSWISKTKDALSMGVANDKSISEIKAKADSISLKVKDLQNGSVDTTKPHTSSQVDFRTLDSDNFYPVMIKLKNGDGVRHTVEINRPLDGTYGSGKSYMTHGGGFSFRLVFSDIANAWGSYEDGQLRIESISQRWTSPTDTPICPRIAQYTPFSFMVAWLRGGSKYDITVDCTDAYISGIWPYMMQVASNPSWVPDAVRFAPDTWTTAQVNEQNPWILLHGDNGGYYADVDNEYLYRFGKLAAGRTFAIVGQPKDSKVWFMATWHITGVSGSKVYVDVSSYGLLWQAQNPLGIRPLGYIKTGASYSKSIWDSQSGFGTSESLDNTAVHANWVVSRPILVIGKESSATNGVYRDRAVLEAVESCTEGSSVSFFSGTYFDVSPLYGTDGRVNVKPNLLATGIDIYSHKIIATTDNFVVRNNSGVTTFSIDKDGNIVGAGNASFKGTVTGSTINGSTINGSTINSTSSDGKSTTKIEGGQVTCGNDASKVIIDMPKGEPGGVIRLSQNTYDYVKIGITDKNGDAYDNIKTAFKSETIASNVAVGPYLRLGAYRQGSSLDFSFMSKNFLFNKHIDAEFINAGGLLLKPYVLDEVEASIFNSLSEVDSQVALDSNPYWHPSVIYFWNNKAITFDLGDPAERDNMGFAKNAGRVLVLWQMGANITFKATPNKTSGNSVSCIFVGRDHRGDTSFLSATLGQCNVFMSDGKRWIGFYVNNPI